MVLEKNMARRTKKITTLAGRLPRVLKTAAGKQGFAEGDLLLNWRRVCPEYFGCTRPLKLRGGTLVVAVNSDSAKLQMQYWLPTLQQRLDQFYGTGMVGRITLVTQSFESVIEETEMITEPAAREDARCGVVKDPDLRQALLRLSRWVKE